MFLEAEISIIGNVLVILDKGQKRRDAVLFVVAHYNVQSMIKILQKTEKYVHIDKRRTYTLRAKNKG